MKKTSIALAFALLASVACAKPAAESPAGPKPEQNRAGHYDAVEKYLHANIADPASLGFVSSSEPELVEYVGKPAWLVHVKYRAKNALGGYVVESGHALIRNDGVDLWATDADLAVLPIKPAKTS